MTEEKTIKPETPKNTEKKDSPAPPKNPYKKGDYKAFVRFYSMPTPYKIKEFGYDTEGSFAKEHNVAQDTLTEWKKREDFNKDVDTQLMKWGANKTPDVLAALFRTILKDGKAGEVKLWLQFIKGLKECMILEQPSMERSNKLNKLLENATPETKRKFAELLKTILPDNRADKKEGD